MLVCLPDTQSNDEGSLTLGWVLGPLWSHLLPEWASFVLVKASFTPRTVFRCSEEIPTAGKSFRIPQTHSMSVQKSRKPARGSILSMWLTSWFAFLLVSIRQPLKSEVEAEPFLFNSLQGTWTSSVNLADMCGLAISAGLSVVSAPIILNFGNKAHWRHQ